MNFRKMIQLGFVMLFILSFAFSAMAVNNEAIINQASTGSGANNAFMKQTEGIGNGINIDQDAVNANAASVTQKGATNLLYGTVDGMTGTLSGPAVQRSVASSNYLLVNQTGINNQIGLSQQAQGSNDANISQSTNNNFLAAYQYASTGFNDLDVLQEVGVAGDKAYLHQEASINNTANIKQYYGDNILTAWQKTLNGSNVLTSYQLDGATANVYQNAVVGNNTATVIQANVVYNP